jgi:hypothetical protein
MAAERFRILYDGSPDIQALKGRLQRGECPLIEIEKDGEIVAASYAAIGDSGLLRDQMKLISVRAEVLLGRAAEGIPASTPPRPTRAPARFSRLLEARRSARRLAGRMLAPFRRTGARRHWNLALRIDAGPVDLVHFDLADYTPLLVDPSTFYADPFVVARDDCYYLFAEACPHATGKGVIVVAEIAPGGVPGPWRTVLEQSWHLSYPYVFEHGDETWLMPESSARGGVEIYRAVEFPDRWELVHTLFEGLPIVDATLFEHDERLWLLAGVATAGGSDWDELFAWHAPAVTGPWTAHALNPIKSDCRSARPGGRPLRLGDRLVRPAQRCEKVYGEALVWLEIRTLTPEAFEEVEIAEWRATGPGLSGPHAADLATPCRAIDYRMELPAA